MTTISHFAINAQDVERARAFYEQVFDWRFEAWGPPGFYQIEGAGVRGALQTRRRIVPDRDVFGFECTVAVPDVDAAVAAAVEHGGRVVMDRSTIAGVGHLVFIEDPEKNILGLMQYDADAT